MPSRTLHLAPLALLVAMLAARAAVAADDAPITFGLTRPFGVQATVESGKVLEDFFSRKLGRTVHAKLYGSYEALSDALAEGSVDFAWITPLGYVRAAERSQVIIIRKSRRNGLPYYRAAVFARADSGIRRLGDLKGRRVAWGPAWSASGNLFPRAMLLEQRIDLAQLFASQQTLSDHAAVCRAVHAGEVDVGASFAEDRSDLGEPQLDGCLPAFKGRLHDFRIVLTSDPIPNDVVAARAGLDTALAGKIGSLLDVLLPQDEVLRDGFRCDGFATGSDRDFDPIRRVLRALPRG